MNEKKIEDICSELSLELNIEKSADGTTPASYKFIASKQIVDRDGDIVFIGKNEAGNGIDVSEYLENPVFLAFHDAQSFPVGKALSVTKAVDAAGIPVLNAEIEFAETDDGLEAKYLYDNGFMKAVSIRFRPTKYVFNEVRGGYDVFDCKLYEISAVPLPANQAALIQKGLKAIKTLEKRNEIDEIIEKKLSEIALSFGVTGSRVDAGAIKKSVYDVILDLKKKIGA